MSEKHWREDLKWLVGIVLAAVAVYFTYKQYDLQRSQLQVTKSASAPSPSISGAIVMGFFLRYWPTVVLVAVLVSIWFLFFVYERPIQKKRDPNDMFEDAKKALEKGKQADQPPNWLLQIAETDLGNVDTFVYSMRETTYNRPALSAPEPYIDFYFGFINASVFAMTLGGVEGRLHYLNHPLSRDAEPFGDSPFVVPHGDYRQVGVRQYVAPSVVERLRSDAATRHMQPGNFALIFRYTDHRGVERVLRKTFSEVLRIESVE